MFLIALLCISTKNTDQSKDIGLQELVLKLSEASSLGEIKKIVSGNYCLDKSILVNEPYFECRLTSRFLKDYKASKLFSVVEDYFIKETTGEKYDEFLFILGGYGLNQSKKARVKKRIKLESDFKKLNKMLEDNHMEIGYDFRKGDESPEIETVSYQLNDSDNSGFIKICKYHGGCFSQALITIGFYKLMVEDI